MNADVPAALRVIVQQMDAASAWHWQHPTTGDRIGEWVADGLPALVNVSNGDVVVSTFATRRDCRLAMYRLTDPPPRRGPRGSTRDDRSSD